MKPLNLQPSALNLIRRRRGGVRAPPILPIVLIVVVLRSRFLAPEVRITVPALETRTMRESQASSMIPWE
jgi:hypothetical protein